MSKKKTIVVQTPLSEDKHNKLPITSVSHKNEEQKEYLRTIANNMFTFADGIAGSGKTHIAVMWGLNQVLTDKYHRLVVCRPYIMSERLGFLPGGFQSKIEPLLWPVYTILVDTIGSDAANQLIKDNRISVIPMGYLRGVTFNNSIVIVDEAQNCSIDLIRTTLTRMSETSKLIVNGDTTQSDLSGPNGLSDAFERLQGIEEIGFCRLKTSVRHRLIAKIEERYRK